MNMNIYIYIHTSTYISMYIYIHMELHGRMVRMPRPQLSILESHNIHLHRRKWITFLDSCAVLAFVAAECPTMQKHVRKGGLKKAASHLAAFMQDGYFECQSGRTERCLFLRRMIRETRRNSWSFFTLRSQHCSNELKEGCCLSLQASDQRLDDGHLPLPQPKPWRFPYLETGQPHPTTLGPGL